MGPAYVAGKKVDLFATTIKRIEVVLGRHTETVPAVAAGNICGLVGIDQFLVKAGTITTSETACCIKTVKFVRSPVVRVELKVKNAMMDLPQLINGLRKLSKSHPMLSCVYGESGEYMVSGCSLQQVQGGLKDLDYFMSAPLIQSDPIVTYCETVTAESSDEVYATSSNKHNRLFAVVQPIAMEIQVSCSAALARSLARLTRSLPRLSLTKRCCSLAWTSTSAPEFSASILHVTGKR